MQINEEEARLTLAALHVAEFEQGEDSESRKLATRIRQEFPAIDKELRIKARRDYIWSELVEQDSRVIEVRKKLKKTPFYFKEKEMYNPKYNDVLHELQVVKEKVAEELEETVPQDAPYAH